MMEPFTKLGVMVVLLLAAIVLSVAYISPTYSREWMCRAFVACVIALTCVALVGCAQAPVIQPVRYQPVEVLITKPCLAARKLPEPAELLTVPKCTKSAAECVRDAAADIDALKTEAAQARKLLQECSR